MSYNSFKKFFHSKPQDQPFYFWPGSIYSHGKFAQWDYYPYYGGMRNKYGWKVDERPQ